jgi:hypothetical protein
VILHELRTAVLRHLEDTRRYTLLDANWGPHDVNNGDYNLPPLVAGPFYSLPDDNNEIVANYSVVNSGHSPRDDIINAMIQAGIQGAGAAVGTFGSGSTPTNNSFGGAAGGNILGSLLNMFSPTAMAWWSTTRLAPSRAERWLR